MINFVNDYVGMIITPQVKWLRKHWKGYLVLCTISYLFGYNIGYKLFTKVKL